ncbi:MAG: shikimate dehydrogenase [Ferruginibacter sp.]
MNLYGLIGYPLGHSFSKKYFTEKFEKENLTDCFFELFPFENIKAFPTLINKEKELRGLAVTIPYKESVIPYLSFLDEKAKEIGAVNCLKIYNKHLLGYNTDALGFERSFVPLLQSNHAKALVLGSGGSSKAVQYVLRKLGIEFLVVTRQAVSGKDFISYDKIDKQMIASYPIIINCTPVGMSPNDDAYPQIPYQWLDQKNLLYDLIYSPAETQFLKKGLERGADVKNGYEMLVIQAEENWRIWRGL